MECEMRRIDFSRIVGHWFLERLHNLLCLPLLVVTICGERSRTMTVAWVIHAWKVPGRGVLHSAQRSQPRSCWKSFSSRAENGTRMARMCMISREEVLTHSQTRCMFLPHGRCGPHTLASIQRFDSSIAHRYTRWIARGILRKS